MQVKLWTWAPDGVPHQDLPSIVTRFWLEMRFEDWRDRVSGLGETQCQGYNCATPGVYKYVGLALQVGGVSNWYSKISSWGLRDSDPEWLRWRGPATIVYYRHVLSSEWTFHINDTATDCNKKSSRGLQKGFLLQNRLADGPSVVTWLWLWQLLNMIKNLQVFMFWNVIL
jgi:hypothetical protein